MQPVLGKISELSNFKVFNNKLDKSHINSDIIFLDFLLFYYFIREENKPNIFSYEFFSA